MKSGITLAAITILATGTLVWADHHKSAEESGPWFDMVNCACCKHMGANMDMMPDIQWENHLLKNGGMMTAVIPEKHKQRWDKVCTQMKSVGEDIAAGKDVPLCNFCVSYNDLMQAGANIEDIQTGFGSVTLVTSDKPDVVDKIHKHFKKTQAAQKEMEQATSG